MVQGQTFSRILLALAAVAVLVTASGAGFMGWHYWQKRVRSTAYDSLICQTAWRHGVAPSLVKAVIWQESRFHAHSVGRAKEMGLMQITEGAVIDWRQAFGRPMPSRVMCFDPSLNIEIGTWYLARAMRNWRQYRSADILALTEYNAGRTRARDAAPPNPQTEVTIAAVRVPSTRGYIVQVRRKWHDFERAQHSRG